MMTNVMMKTCLNQKNIKISNLIQAMKSSVCPKPKVIRRPNFSESRICPNIYRMFRSVDWTHDMIIVKWREVTLFSESRIFNFSESRICPNKPEYLPIVPKCRLNTRDDIREVTLIHLTRAQTLRSDICSTGSIHASGSMTVNFHANCSTAQVYVLHPRQFIFALTCRRLSFLQVLQSTERSERYFEKLFVYLIMTNVMVKTCLNQKIIETSNLSECRICPNIYRNVPSCGLNAWHDNREVTLNHLTRAQTLRSDKCATGLINANGSLTINAIPC